MNFTPSTLIAVAAIAASLINISHAGEWYHQTTASSNVEADSNKRLRSENEKGVVGINARVDIKLSNVTEISEVYVRGALRSVRYDGDDDRGVDTDDQLLYAGGRWNGERSQLTVDGEFLRQSSQFTELEDTGFFEDVNRRVDKSLSSQYSYTLLENTQVFAGVSYAEVDFPDSIPVSLTEYSVESVNTGVVYNFDELNYVTLSLFNSNYEADTFVSDVETNGANIRYDKTIDELWRGYAQVGYRKSNFKNQVSGMIVRDDDTGASYDVGATRQSPASTLSIEVSNSLEPSADGDVNERTEVSFAYQRAFSDRLSSRVDLNWFENESINNDQDSDREYWTLSIGADYRLAEKWYLTGQVRHRDQKIKDDINSTNADSDAVIIGIRYSGQNNRI
jgi:predicted porin